MQPTAKVHCALSFPIPFFLVAFLDPPSSPISLFLQNVRQWEVNNVRWERVDLLHETEPSSVVPVLMALPSDQREGDRRPVVIVLHGTADSKDGVPTPIIERYAREFGWVGVAIDMRYHGERRESTEGPGTRGLDDYFAALIRSFRSRRDQSQDREYPFIYDMAWDISRLLDYFETRDDIIDSAHIASTGISLGGMVSWFAAAADPRITVVAPAIGVQSFRYALDKECFHARVNTLKPLFDVAVADGGLEEPTSELVAQVWDAVVPGIYGDFDAPQSLALIAPRPLLIVNGEEDPRCPAEGVRAAVVTSKALVYNEYPEWEIELVLEIGVPHEMTSNMWSKINAFFKTHLPTTNGDESRTLAP